MSDDGEGGYCSHCGHSKGSHEHLENLDIDFCWSEVMGLVCGCQGKKPSMRDDCNVCGKKCGNTYVLDKHLGENPKCKEGFTPTYW